MVTLGQPAKNKDHGVNTQMCVEKLHGFVITIIRTPVTQSLDLDLLFLCVFEALRRKPVQYERVLAVSLGVRGSSIPTTTWRVLVCTCRHRYGTG